MRRRDLSCKERIPLKHGFIPTFFFYNFEKLLQTKEKNSWLNLFGTKGWLCYNFVYFSYSQKVKYFQPVTPNVIYSMKAIQTVIHFWFIKRDDNEEILVHATFIWRNICTLNDMCSMSYHSHHFFRTKKKRCKKTQLLSPTYQ